MNLVFQLADTDPADAVTERGVRCARAMRAELEALLFRAEAAQLPPDLAISLSPPDRNRIAALVLRALEVFP